LEKITFLFISLRLHSGICLSNKDPDLELLLNVMKFLLLISYNYPLTGCRLLLFLRSCGYKCCISGSTRTHNYLVLRIRIYYYWLLIRNLPSSTQTYDIFENFFKKWANSHTSFNNNKKLSTHLCLHTYQNWKLFFFISSLQKDPNPKFIIFNMRIRIRIL